MREETLRVLEEITLAGDGDYRRVFDAPFTYVNRELGQLYGLSAPADGYVRANLPADGLRLGLLGHASFLASNAHEATTSPTRRGKFVREVLLCHEIPAPPPDVDASLPEEKPGDAPRTMRERLSGHNAPACTACHVRMDPLGLAFENFDALGTTGPAMPARRLTPAATWTARPSAPRASWPPCCAGTPTSTPAWCAASTATPSATSRRRVKRCSSSASALA